MSKASKKTVEKEKKKIVEDKTFGLKNKNKSKKVEKYIKSVESQVSNKGVDKKAEAARKQREEDKKKSEEAKREMELLFKPVVVQPKLAVGVDPKSVVCELFKIGSCSKGKQCKYSHDLNVARKVEKIDIYVDRRNTAEEDESMDGWDEEKLKEVVAKKQTNATTLKNPIVCKYFLDAIEQHKYGWRWECPNNGDKCPYMHALPPGFQLKKKKDPNEEEPEETSIEEIIEEERKKLTTHTPVTLDTFKKWKEEKKRKKEEEAAALAEQRAKDIKAGKTQMSGREMFVFNPDLFVDDDAAIQSDDLPPEEPDEEDNQTTTTTSADNEDSELAVEVDQSLFVGGDEDLPSDEDDE